MAEYEELKRKRQEELKEGVRKGDLARIIEVGLKALWDALTNEQIPFHKFLFSTGHYLNNRGVEIEEKENLTYAGGIMLLEIRQEEHLDCGDGEVCLKIDQSEMLNSVIIHLSVQLYFMLADRTWVQKTIEGQVDSRRFTDWSTDKTAMQLRNEGRLKFKLTPKSKEREIDNQN